MPPPGVRRRIVSAHVNTNPGSGYVLNAASAWLYVKEEVVPIGGHPGGDGTWLCVSTPPASPTIGGNYNAGFSYALKTGGGVTADTAPGSDGAGTGNHAGTGPVELVNGMEVHLQYIAHPGTPDDHIQVRLRTWDSFY